MSLLDSPRVHEAKRRHALDEALWFLWNRGASPDHHGEGEEAERLKADHDSVGLSPEQLARIKALLPLILRSELEQKL